MLRPYARSAQIGLEPVNSLKSTFWNVATAKVVIMKPMIWHPEEKDQKVNQYLEQVNHAPYAVIVGLLLAVLFLFTFSFLFVFF